MLYHLLYRLLRQGLLFIMVIMLTNCASHAPSQTMKLDQLFSEYQGDTVPGAAVMVVKEGKILYQQGYGMAVFSEATRVSADSNFRLASVSKQFTALAILQLIEQDKFQLSTPLSELLPSLPDWSQSITVKDMLRHTSGIVDYEKLLPDSYVGQVVDADVLRLLETQNELYFTPGSEYQYSNSAYALLALIVEKTSGLNYSDYLDQYIFKPLGMNTTVALDHARHQVMNRVYGYQINPDGSVELADQSRFSAVLGDGGIYSNLNDLFRWINALDGNGLLSSPLAQQWVTDQKNDQGQAIQYGFGWRLEQYAGYDVVYHTGISRGFRNVLYRIPAQQLSIVILTNRTTDGRLTPLQMARTIVDRVL